LVLMSSKPSAASAIGCTVNKELSHPVLIVA
jgi:hypothetical protein